MRVFRRSKFQRHLVIPLMLTCFLLGCYKWSAQPGPATLHEAPERARITLSDGRVVELESPEIRGDSVVGFTKTENRRSTGQPVWGDTLQTFPLADVRRVEGRKTDVVGTVGLVVGIGAALLIVSAVILESTGGLLR